MADKKKSQEDRWADSNYSRSQILVLACCKARPKMSLASLELATSFQILLEVFCSEKWHCKNFKVTSCYTMKHAE